MSKCERQQAIEAAKKDAMRAKDKDTLGTIRMILAEIKRIEVDERIELDDARVIAVMDKMLKQRKDSIEQFTNAGRDDLVAQEESEMKVIQGFLPEPLSADELAAMIEQAISQTGAESMKDMGKVMGILKPQLQGRADMGQVSGQIKARLNG